MKQEIWKKRIFGMEEFAASLQFCHLLRFQVMVGNPICDPGFSRCAKLGAQILQLCHAQELHQLHVVLVRLCQLVAQFERPCPLANGVEARHERHHAQERNHHPGAQMSGRRSSGNLGHLFKSADREDRPRTIEHRIEDFS